MSDAPCFNLTGGGGGNRTRVRKCSTLGPTCLVCLLFLTVRYSTEQRKRTASPKILTISTSDKVSLRSCVKLPLQTPHNTEFQTHKHNLVRGWPIKQPGRSCRRWQLFLYSLFYEVGCTSACTSGFITHVEATSPPNNIPP